jgi:hypothetical protein
VVVPIPKKVGATDLADLRPLKLLEVSRKGALGIFKDRIRVVLEERGILHAAQHGFRKGFSTATAAMILLNAAEEAGRYGKELHVLCLGIRKACDTVVRMVWTEGAMRRVGVPMEVCALLLECERENVKEMRTVWDPLLEADQFQFEAERGLLQGSAVSPLLWTIFYDMVICELERRGVGRSVMCETE